MGKQKKTFQDPLIQAFYLEFLTWGMSGCVAKSQFGIPGVRSACQFSQGAGRPRGLIRGFGLGFARVFLA